MTAQERESLARLVHGETRTLLVELLDRHDAESLFANVDAAAFHTILGVALAHAAIWRCGGDSAHRAAALELVERYLRERGRPHAWPRVLARLRTHAAWNPREAIEAGSTLGWILLALRASLSADEGRPLLKTVLATRATLRSAGAIRFYINGNYAIPLCELAFLWRHFEGSDDVEQYEACWQMLVDPASCAPRWEGYGWTVAVAPTDEDWLDAEGYFTETPGYIGRFPRDTFDPEYSQLQLERLTRLWLLNGDQRALRHIRAIHSLLLNYLDRERWTITSSAASRSAGSARFFSPASCLLALHSPHDDVAVDFAVEQFHRGVLAEYHDGGWASNPYLLRGLGTILTPLLLLSAPADAAWSAPVAPLAGERPLPARAEMMRDAGLGSTLG